jgi:hypothetical protein
LMDTEATRRSGPEAYILYVEDATTTKATKVGAKGSLASWTFDAAAPV